MYLKLFFIALYFYVIAISQQSESGSQCQGPPTVNCNCGASSQDGSVSEQSINIRQGRPGRVGPIGRVGPKGQKVSYLSYKTNAALKLFFLKTT